MKVGKVGCHHPFHAPPKLKGSTTDGFVRDYDSNFDLKYFLFRNILK